jgi:glutamate racemase
LIGTKRTVQSNVYAKKLSEREAKVELRSLATPLLAPMIEEGFFNNQISHEIIAQYLSDPSLADIDAIVLACTHYPLIKREIDNYYEQKVHILDSSDIIATALKSYLEKISLLAPSGTMAQHQFMVSDYTASFEASTKMFFHELVHLERHPLWS